MATYNIYLGNPAKLEYPWKRLVDEVQRLLSPAFAAGSRWDRLYVKSTMSAPTLLEGEVLVYVVRSQLSSVLGRKLGLHPEPGHGGLTQMTDSRAASEAYMQGTDTPMLARVICHELFHNKTGLENEQMHALGGLCASPTQAPIRSNYDLLRKHLAKPVQQWLGGF